MPGSASAYSGTRPCTPSLPSAADLCCFLRTEQSSGKFSAEFLLRESSAAPALVRLVGSHKTREFTSCVLDGLRDCGCGCSSAALSVQSPWVATLHTAWPPTHLSGSPGPTSWSKCGSQSTSRWGGRVQVGGQEGGEPRAAPAHWVCLGRAGEACGAAQRLQPNTGHGNGQ